MRWRRGEAADVPELARLNQQLIEDEGHDNGMDLPQLEQRMAGWLSRGYRAVLFEEAGRTVAYALYRDGERGGHYLRQLFVVRDGRRAGRGREAMALLEREVLRPGARLYLEVLTSNAAARAFYEALGFSSYAVTLEKAGPEGRVGAFNFIQASERVATSGAVPPGGFERMAAAGYGSVINLLPDDNEHALPQEAERVAEHGMDYVHIPVDFGAPTDADFEAFVDAMRAREGDKIWVHCAANYRVSAFFSLYAQRQLGWSVERADALVARAWEPDAVWSAFIRRVRDP